MVSPRFYVLSDASGPIGVFTTVESAVAIKKQFSMADMIISSFPIDITCPTDSVFCVLYRETNFVAFVSNNRAKCERVQKLLASINAVYNDPIDFWHCTPNKIIPAALNRLEMLQHVSTLAHDQTIEEQMALSDKHLEELLSSITPPTQGDVDDIMDFVCMDDSTHGIIHNSEMVATDTKKEDNVAP